MTILDGKKAAESVYEELARAINPRRPPSIVMVLVGENAPSLAYVTMKKKAAERLGMRSHVIALPSSITEETLLAEIDILNKGSFDGILVQMPLPAHINTQKIICSIDPQKDVDGLHPYNAGLLSLGQTEGFIPCTPLGIRYLLNYYQVPLAGKHVVILGRSNLVGRPLAALLSQKALGGNSTVTLAHSQSSNLQEICLSADILVAAMGSPLFVKEEMVEKGTTVIDVGISRHAGKIVGDVDFAAVQHKCHAITPVPGGIGPMTIAMLLSNTFKSCSQRKSAKLLSTF